MVAGCAVSYYDCWLVPNVRVLPVNKTAAFRLPFLFFRPEMPQVNRGSARQARMLIKAQEHTDQKC